MIRVVHVHKSFGSKKVLQGINLEVKKGETMAVIGQSGSGKTVLLKLLMGLMKPDKGSIVIEGMDITQLKEDQLYKVRKKIGMLFQGAALFDSLSVAQNVSFGLERYTDWPLPKIRERVRESLNQVGLSGVESLMPHQLSGGMKKRVGLARAIAYQPQIIFYDEPSTGVDPIRADAIEGLINLLKKQMEVTSVVITHDMRSSYKIADRVAMLYQGRIIKVGTPEEIRKSEDMVIQQFIQGKANGPIVDW